MDEDEIWQAIRQVVESGEEGLKIDLKYDLPRLDQDNDKAEFVKDVSAIANATGKIGYIVIGVRDKQHRTPNDPYVIDFDPLDLEIRIQQMTQAAQEYIQPPIIMEYHTITHPQTGRKIGVVVVPSSYDRPYIIGKDIGPLKKVTIFSRSTSHTVEVSHEEIVHMATEDVRILYEEQLKENNKRINILEKSIDEMNDTIDHMERLYNTMKDTMTEENKNFAEDKSNWLLAAEEACLLLYSLLPEQIRDDKVRELLRRYGKEDYYSRWFARRI